MAYQQRPPNIYEQLGHRQPITAQHPQYAAARPPPVAPSAFHPAHQQQQIRYTPFTPTTPISPQAPGRPLPTPSPPKPAPPPLHPSQQRPKLPSHTAPQLIHSRSNSSITQLQQYAQPLPQHRPKHASLDISRNQQEPSRSPSPHFGANPNQPRTRASTVDNSHMTRSPGMQQLNQYFPQQQHQGVPQQQHYQSPQQQQYSPQTYQYQQPPPPPQHHHQPSPQSYHQQPYSHPPQPLPQRQPSQPFPQQTQYQPQQQYFQQSPEASPQPSPTTPSYQPQFVVNDRAVSPNPSGELVRKYSKNRRGSPVKFSTAAPPVQEEYSAPQPPPSQYEPIQNDPIPPPSTSPSNSRRPKTISEALGMSPDIPSSPPSGGKFVPLYKRTSSRTTPSPATSSIMPSEMRLPKPGSAIPAGSSSGSGSRPLPSAPGPSSGAGRSPEKKAVPLPSSSTSGVAQVNRSNGRQGQGQGLGRSDTTSTTSTTSSTRSTGSLHRRERAILSSSDDSASEHSDHEHEPPSPGVGILDLPSRSTNGAASNGLPFGALRPGFERTGLPEPPMMQRSYAQRGFSSASDPSQSESEDESRGRGRGQGQLQSRIMKYAMNVNSANANSSQFPSSPKKPPAPLPKGASSPSKPKPPALPPRTGSRSPPKPPALQRAAQSAGGKWPDGVPKLPKLPGTPGGSTSSPAWIPQGLPSPVSPTSPASPTKRDYGFPSSPPSAYRSPRRVPPPSLPTVEDSDEESTPQQPYRRGKSGREQSPSTRQFVSSSPPASPGKMTRGAFRRGSGTYNGPAMSLDGVMGETRMGPGPGRDGAVEDEYGEPGHRHTNSVPAAQQQQPGSTGTGNRFPAPKVHHATTSYSDGGVNIESPAPMGGRERMIQIRMPSDSSFKGALRQGQGQEEPKSPTRPLPNPIGGGGGGGDVGQGQRQQGRFNGQNAQNTYQQQRDVYNREQQSQSRPGTAHTQYQQHQPRPDVFAQGQQQQQQSSSRPGSAHQNQHKQYTSSNGSTTPTHHRQQQYSPSASGSGHSTPTHPQQYSPGGTPIAQPRPSQPIMIEVPGISVAPAAEPENEVPRIQEPPSIQVDEASSASVPQINIGGADDDDNGVPGIQISVSVNDDSSPNNKDSGGQPNTQREMVDKANPHNRPAIQRYPGLRCGLCAGHIVGRMVDAMGVRWHPACFRCTVCDELLEHVSSYEMEGRPYCHLDYHENFAPRCYHCKTAIVESRFISIDDEALGGRRTYHENHFFCSECGDPFLDPSRKTHGLLGSTDGELTLSEGQFEGFTVYRGYPYCEACHVRLRNPKCRKCKKAIRDGDKAVEALGGKWCWECFTCAGCDRPFDEPSFFERNKKPWCEKCFSIILRNEV